MFFLLSKLLVIFIYPITWIVLVFLLSIFSRNKKLQKRFLLSGFFLLLFFSLPIFQNSYARIWDITTRPDNKHYNAAIVLGGYGSEDRNGGGYFNGASDRFIQGARLKISGRVSYLVFTGGNANVLLPKSFRESRWTAEILKDFKVDPKEVLTENESRNTLENAIFTQRLLKKNNIPPPYLLVTSAFHMRRSLLTFEKAGVEVVPYSCNYIAGHERLSIDSFLPNADTLSKWEKYIKELIGYIVYYLKS
ncbi:YdcF family protein [Desertivirga arenae]|uniref:YdcF family protein n=1 Tax=Desertivirga arenae TaxID=2810309 RepID=UPI001A977EE1|nr:YdcF family protein [Pedobacter sp. SYSU D00823]